MTRITRITAASLLVGAVLSSFILHPSSFAAERSFPRGAIPSPRHKLLAAPQHKPAQAPPPQIFHPLIQNSMWCNDRFGCCVTSAQACCKAAGSPQIFIPDDEVKKWAERHGYLNGADISSVLTTMETDGFQIGSQRYDDGPFSSVDYSNETVLQSALAVGPNVTGIDANALPSGAGNQQGWFALGNGTTYSNQDHCVTILGFGPAEWLYSQIDVTMPPSLAGTSGYLVDTWDTIGFVDHAWIMSTVGEDWVSNPTTVGVPPLTPPAPSPAPVPAPSPAPGSTSVTFGEAVQLVIVAAKTDLTQSQAAGIAAFFGDESSPRVTLLKSVTFELLKRQGKIPAGTSIDAVNWQGLIQFMQAMMPLIEQMIIMFGGDAHAILEPSQHLAATLCALAGDDIAGDDQTASTTLDLTPQRPTCGRDGCPRVPNVRKPSVRKAVRPTPKQAGRPSQRRKLFRGRFLSR